VYGAPLDLELVTAWIGAGARLVGGCCGTGPAEIADIADIAAIAAEVSGPEG
jgi:homocysteine S-methyltransferase